MTAPISDPTSGNLLRQLRLSKGLDMAEVARLVNLSVAQVRQLETENPGPQDRSYFYTAAIKEKAAIKVALALGAEPQIVAGMQADFPESPVLQPHNLQTLDDLAALYKKQAQAREMGAAERFFSWKWASALAILLLMAGAIHQRQALSVWLDDRTGLWEKAPALTSTTEPTNVPAPQTDAPLESVSAAVVSPTSLCESPSLPATLQASQVSKPSKPGNSVHIVAVEDLMMCVRDALGKETLVTLKAQESKTVLGKSPWFLRLEKPVPLHVFYQGQKIQWPEGSINAVMLKETPGDY